MSRISDHQRQLLSEWQRLSEIWDDARTKWRDRVRLEFERQYWDELEKQTLDYSNALDALCEGCRNLS